MPTRSFAAAVFLACVAAGCSGSQRAPATSDAPVEPDTDAGAPAESPATPEQVQAATNLANDVCGCVDRIADEPDCVHKIRRRSLPKLPRSDERVARQIERAQACVRLAKLEQDERSRSLLSKFLEALFR